MSFAFTAPRKAILTQEQLQFFQSSPTHNEVIGYIEVLNESVIGTKISDISSNDDSEGVKSVMAILDRVDTFAKEIPAVDNKGSRFGNPAFKTFYDKVVESSDELHASIRPPLPTDAQSELSTYFNEAWGNRTRVDYGSGMELNFLCWMLCLERLDIFSESDHKALVLRVFWRYIQVMRTLQSQYWLEPAGSHGVWGLDDYHFLPFLWGAAQLRGHKYLKPKSIHEKDVVDMGKGDYMYLACIDFVDSIKTGSLRWHSPMLDDISGVRSWDKVNTGMIKMFRAEVLGKLPVVQHFYFGSMLPIPENLPALPQSAQDDESRFQHAGHVHDIKNNGFGDCCGIPVPSAFGAKAAEGDRKAGVPLTGKGIRPVPFD